MLDDLIELRWGSGLSAKGAWLWRKKKRVRRINVRFFEANLNQHATNPCESLLLVQRYGLCQHKKSFRQNTVRLLGDVWLLQLETVHLNFYCIKKAPQKIVSSEMPSWFDLVRLA